MAHCPNCGCNHIQLKRETNISWGRAVAGWVLFGVVGGAVGGVTGKDRNVNACLDCGTTWKATDLHNTLEIIKNLTQTKLDLSLEEDRLYLSDFMKEIGPYLDSISKAEEKVRQIIERVKTKKSENALKLGTIGCLTSILLAFAGLVAITVNSFASILIFILMIVVPFPCWRFGVLLDVAKTKKVDKEIQKIEKDANTIKKEAELDFQYKVKDFIARHSTD